MLHASGFTPRVLTPDREHELLVLGLGITNVVERASARADELSREEMQAGAAILHAKVLKYQPLTLAILGVGAYRDGFLQPKAVVGPQPEKIGQTALWVLPNPSGLNAHYQAGDLANVFRKLHDSLG